MGLTLPHWYSDKPIATVKDLGTHGEWTEQNLTEEDVAGFRSIVGCDAGSKNAPQGIVPTLARSSYLNVHRAPPGGVLARLRWTNFSAFPPSGAIKTRSAVVADYEKRGRRRVEINVELAHPDGRLIATTVWELVWPEGAE